MSPSSGRSLWSRIGLSNPLEVELRPGELWIGPGTRHAPTERLSSPEAESASGEESGESWTGSVAVLDRALAGRSRRSSLRVVLSDHFVRYALLPWSAELVADAERVAFARLTLRETYGPAADLWEVCIDEQPAGQASLIAAADRALMSTLRDIVARHRLTLSAVVPSLSDRVERYRRALKAPEFCLACAEPGRLTLAFRSKAGWTSLRGRRMDGALQDVLPSALRQEATAGAAHSVGTLYLVATHFRHLATFTVPGWQIEWLTEPQVELPAPAQGATEWAGN